MALKDHSLDSLIIDAARTEFMEHGFQKASLHKIAERAGSTTGALYTRYKNKDDLFCSLIHSLTEEISAHLGSMPAFYREAHRLRTADAILKVIRMEEEICLELLFRHYEECVLLLCKSSGSSLEMKMNQMIKEKARQTVEFFRSMAVKEIDFDGIELIMTEQMTYYRQMLLRGYSKEKALSCMKTVDLFLESGWKEILDRIL